MTDNHPITPPPELVQQWASAFYGTTIAPGEAAIDTATQAAQWGADQELEACCKDILEIIAGIFADRVIYDWDQLVELLRDGRRPQPPTLKEQAFDALKDLSNGIEWPDSWEIIRRALEQLNG